MLPIKNRLKKREDFSTIFSKGAYAAFDELSIKYTKNSLDVSRIGFPIGKNYSKKAVVRNRSRRVLRKACSDLLIQIKPGFDIVLLIKPSYQHIELGEITRQLQKVLSKANLLM